MSILNQKKRPEKMNQTNNHRSHTLTIGPFYINIPDVGFYHKYECTSNRINPTLGLLEPILGIEGDPPEWTYHDSDEVQKVVPVKLTRPSVLSCVVSIDKKKIEVASILPAISPRLDEKIDVYVYKKSGGDHNKLFVIAGYNSADSDDSNNTNVIPLSLDFTITDTYFPEIAGITEIEMYLLQEDPKTSRGTVTTVQRHVLPSVKKEE